MSLMWVDCAETVFPPTMTDNENTAEWHVRKRPGKEDDGTTAARAVVSVPETSWCHTDKQDDSFLVIAMVVPVETPQQGTQFWFVPSLCSSLVVTTDGWRGLTHTQASEQPPFPGKLY